MNFTRAETLRGAATAVPENTTGAALEDALRRQAEEFAFRASPEAIEYF